MTTPKKPAGQAVLHFIGWVLIIFNLYFLLLSLVLAFAALFGWLETSSLGEQFKFFGIFLLMSAVFLGLALLGFRLKNTGKEKPAPKRRKSTGIPVRFQGTKIYIDPLAFYEWKDRNPSSIQYEMQGALPLTKKQPVLTLYEDGKQTRQYCLQTEGDENFAGKYFHISVRLSSMGPMAILVAQIDGFVADTPDRCSFGYQHIGYRMEGHFLAYNGKLAELMYEKNEGQDLIGKGLKYPGRTIPSNVRLIGICSKCQKSFAFHAYAFYMMQNDVAYSDDGLDCCEVTQPVPDKENWAYTTEGKTFRYYNSFCCPHCGEPYIDYRKHPGNKIFGAAGCVHLGRKHFQQT